MYRLSRNAVVDFSIISGSIYRSGSEKVVVNTTTLHSVTSTNHKSIFVNHDNKCIYSSIFWGCWIKPSVTTCGLEYSYTQVNKICKFLSFASICHPLAQIVNIGGTPIRWNPTASTQHTPSLILISHIMQVRSEAYYAGINYKSQTVFSCAIIRIAVVEIVIEHIWNKSFTLATLCIFFQIRKNSIKPTIVSKILSVIHCVIF